MKNRIIALAVALSMLFLSSCSLIKSVRSMINDMNYISDHKDDTVSHESESEPFDETAVSSIDDYLDRLNEMLEDNDPSRSKAFVELYDDLTQEIYYLMDQANLAFVTFCKDTANDENSVMYDRLTKLSNDRYGKLVRLYKPIYESNYSEQFYDEWSAEEISEALTLAEMYSEKHVALTDAVNEYVQEYEKLDRDSYSFSEKSAELYAEIVKKNIEVAANSGYGSYADYAYEKEYERDFTPADAEKFYRYVRDYIIPLGESLLQSLRSYSSLGRVVSECSALTEEDVNESVLDKKLIPYYTMRGEKALEGYSSFKEHYTASSSKNAHEIAYTYYLNYYGHPGCFFGPGCQSLMTYVHEQGHYMAFWNLGDSYRSFDLCETQSQGNEWLYLSTISEDYSETFYRYLIAYILLNDILSVVISTTCDAFEQYVYDHPDLKYTEYDSAFISVSKSIGTYNFLRSSMSGSPENYWHRAVVANSFYYLSYAVSLIPVFELYVIAREEGFDKATEIYDKLTNLSYDVGFVEALEESGLTSPFDESVFKRISDYFSY